MHIFHFFFLLSSLTAFKGSNNVLSLLTKDSLSSELHGKFTNCSHICKDFIDLKPVLIVDQSTSHIPTCFFINTYPDVFHRTITVEDLLHRLIWKRSSDTLDVQAREWLELQQGFDLLSRLFFVLKCHFLHIFQSLDSE